MAVLESGRRNIVILGAGFGGITALLKLYRGLERNSLQHRYHLVLVNRNAYHLYTPALYEIAAIPKGAADSARLKTSICIPIDDILEHLPGVRFVGEIADALDPERHIITFASGDQLNFEYLIIALGAETNFFGIPGMAERALPMKTFEDALHLRNRVEELIRATTGNFCVLVAGGGATGVELSAELVNFLCYVKKRMAAGKCQEEITLIEASPEILPGFSHEVIKRVRRRLRKLGVFIRAGTRIREVRATDVLLDTGVSLPYHILIWAGGVRPPSVLKNFGLPLTDQGNIATNEFLEARAETGAPATRVALASGRIYAIGDNAHFIHPKTGQPVAGSVPVAEAGARLAAKNIIAEIIGQRKKIFRPAVQYPFILALGGKYAVTDLIVVKFFGFAGWFLKQLVELRYLLFILPWQKAVITWFRTVHYSLKND